MFASACGAALRLLFGQFDRPGAQFADFLTLLESSPSGRSRVAAIDALQKVGHGVGLNMEDVGHDLLLEGHV